MTDWVLIDEPAPHVRRITMNRPEKRNALNHPLRGAILEALYAGDKDDDVHVQIIRGAGPSFSAGYDLAGGNEGYECPFYTPGGDGQWPRHVTEGWMGIWDLAKPVIAQVHGYCLAGGSELATGCDLVYIAEDAQMGYPAVRFGVPDMHFHAWFLGMRAAMDMMVTGDSITASRRWPRAGPTAPSRPISSTPRCSRSPSASRRCRPSRASSTSASCTGRWTYMGMRTGIRAGTELCAIGTHTRPWPSSSAKISEKGLTAALQRPRQAVRRLPHQVTHRP